MNLSQLQYFQKLAQLEHYTNTARELFISQPSLSASIAALEAELGVKLFRKQGRNVKLTMEGRQFYQHVCKALEMLQEGIDAIQKKEDQNPQGTIALAAQPALLLEQIPALLRQYKRQEGTAKIQFTVSVVSSLESLWAGIRAGQYDCGFCVNPPRQEDIAVLPLFPQRAAAIVEQDHPLAKRKQCTLADLQTFPVAALHKESPLGQPLWDCLLAKNIRPALPLQEEILIGSYLSQNKRLVAVSSTGCVAESPSLVQIPITDLPADLFTVSVLYHRDRRGAKLLQHFLSHLREI